MSTIRFLVVEDDHRMARSIARILGAHGSVEIVGDFESAAQLLVPDQNWDGISMDHLLPGGDGLTLLRILREHDEHTPVMYLTGVEEDSVARQARELNADFVAKPAELAQFQHFISEVLGHSGRCLRNSVCTEFAHKWALSDREEAVFKMLIDGKSQSEISCELDVGAATVKTYVRRVVGKSRLKTLRKVFAEVVNAIAVKARHSNWSELN